MPGFIQETISRGRAGVDVVDEPTAELGDRVKMGRMEGGYVYPERCLDIAEKLRPLLTSFGGPREVFGAVLFIFATEAKSNGTSVDQFVDSVRAIVADIYGQSAEAEN